MSANEADDMMPDAEDVIAALRAELDEARAALDAATATFEDECAAHQDTLRLLATARKQALAEAEGIAREAASKVWRRSSTRVSANWIADAIAARAALEEK